MRLFVALGLPDDLRERLNRMCAGLPGAIWVSPENFHITLRFIGEADRAQAADIAAALSRVQSPRFQLSLTGLGQFGEGRKTRAVWAGVEPVPELTGLQRRVESALVQTGIEPVTRKFHAHVTLARFKSNPGAKLRTYFAQHALFRAAPFEVTSFVLYSSSLGHGGAAYEVEAEFPLTALGDVAE